MKSDSINLGKQLKMGKYSIIYRKQLKIGFDSINIGKQHKMKNGLILYGKELKMVNHSIK